jgi:hypothetical protein
MTRWLAGWAVGVFQILVLAASLSAEVPRQVPTKAEQARIAEGNRLAQWIVQAPASELAKSAIRVLDDSRDEKVLEGAIWVFQRSYLGSLLLGREDQKLTDWAKRYLPRAKALNPQLDEAWVYPQPTVEMRRSGEIVRRRELRVIARLPAEADEGPESEPIPMDFPRLRPERAAGLPAGIVATLQARRCTIPQSDPRRLSNFIQGAFLGRGARNWAVLCSRFRHSTILVFRDENDTQPMELARRKDSGWKLEGERTYYANQLSVVGRARILVHYDASVRPQPPPIDHQGIDDSTLDKASVVHYYYRGRWLELLGAD